MVKRLGSYNVKFYFEFEAIADEFSEYLNSSGYDVDVSIADEYLRYEENVEAIVTVRITRDEWLEKVDDKYRVSLFVHKDLSARVVKMLMQNGYIAIVKCAYDEDEDIVVVYVNQDCVEEEVLFT